MCYIHPCHVRACPPHHSSYRSCIRICMYTCLCARVYAQKMSTLTGTHPQFAIMRRRTRVSTPQVACRHASVRPCIRRCVRPSMHPVHVYRSTQRDHPICMHIRNLCVLRRIVADRVSTTGDWHACANIHLAPRHQRLGRSLKARCRAKTVPQDISILDLQWTLTQI